MSNLLFRWKYTRIESKTEEQKKSLKEKIVWTEGIVNDWNNKEEKMCASDENEVETRTNKL